MNSVQMQKLKDIEKQMLIEFIKICQRHKLQYFLLGGTALGAVRHKGFIPWDDDIDVGMPREDYERFLVYANEELPQPYFLQNGATDPYYAGSFAKIRNTATTFIEQTVQTFPINHGVYIDVFPLDGVPANGFFKVLQRKVLRGLNAWMSGAYCVPEKGISRKAELCRLLYKVLPVRYTWLRDWRDKLIQKCTYADSAVVANFCGAWGEKEVMPKAYFGNGSVGIFEDLEVVLPGDWDAYLSSLYGDYMTPPPENKRVGHHDYTVLDLEKSYTNYI